MTQISFPLSPSNIEMGTSQLDDNMYAIKVTFGGEIPIFLTVKPHAQNQYIYRLISWSNVKSKKANRIANSILNSLVMPDRTLKRQKIVKVDTKDKTGIDGSYQFTYAMHVADIKPLISYLKEQKCLLEVKRNSLRLIVQQSYPLQ